MDTNFVSIADALAGPAGFVPVSARQEPAMKTVRFSDVSDEKQLHPNSRQSVKTDNEPIGSQSNPVEKTPKEFRQTLREKEDSGNLPKAQKNTKSQEQPAGSKIQDRPELVQSWLTQNAVPVENTKATSATKVESKSAQKITAVISNIKTEKSVPITGQAVKAAEIKLLENGDKVQAGLNTVLPEKSQGLNGLRLVQGNSSKNIPTEQALTDITDRTGKTSASNEKTVAAKVSPNAIQTGNQVTQGPAVIDAKLNNTGQKPVVAKIMPVVENPKLSASKTMDSNVAANTGNAGKTASAVGQTPVTDNPVIVETPKASEILQKSVAAETGKSARAVEVETALHTSGFEKAKEAPSAQRKNLNQAGRDVVNDPSLRKSNASEVQVDIGQAKNHSAANFNNSSYQEFSQIISQNGPETQVSANSFSGAGTKLADLSGAASSSDISADVGKQILESIHSSISQQAAEKQVTVRLNPPELGQVFIKLQEQDTQITGVLEVSKAQTKLEIEQALPEITRNLAASGVQVNRIEVVLSASEHSAEHGAKDTLLNDGSYQQQSSSDYGSSGNDYETDGTYYELSNDSVYRNVAEFREMNVSGNSINVLI